MRRSDREVTDFIEITGILRRADALRIGLHDEPYPYVVPLSFGFEATDGKITLYFHGAKEGLKHELIAKNPHVCVEASIFHRYDEVQGSVTTEYESVIGFGKSELVTGEEAAKGLDLLLSHCGFDGFAYDHNALDVTAVYKIVLDSFTGKRRFVKENAHPIPLGKYRHYKGNFYEVTGFAKHSETLEDMVVYKQLYGERKTWVRPLAMWSELVEADGKQVKRFEFIGEGGTL